MASNMRTDLLDRMHVILLIEPRTIKEISKDICVSYPTLVRMRHGKMGAHPRTWYALEKWILQQEQKLGIKHTYNK